MTRTPWLLLLLCAALPAWTLAPGSYLRTYVSAIDGSVQPYGLYLPTTYQAGTPAPVMFNGHGFGSRATGSFTTGVKSFADANGIILVQLDGRGNTFYDGIGAVDLREVLQSLRADATLDDTRLYFEGASMGATGAYRLGIRHPDLLAASAGVDGFADYREWYAHWYGPASSPSTVALFRLPNLLMASCVDAADGATWHQQLLITNTGDTTVPSINEYNLDARLTALGTTTPETDYRHELRVYNGGHTSYYDAAVLGQYFLGKSLVQKPPHVVVQTTRLKYGSQHWVSLGRMLQINTFARVDARATGNAVALTTENVREFTLRLGDSPVNAAQPVSVSVNGQAAYTGPAQAVTLYALLGENKSVTGWTTTDPTPAALHKTPALEGPIGDAYTSPFLVLYGAPTDAGVTAANKAAADAFCANWNSWMHAAISARADTTVTDAEIAGKNLILFGASFGDARINTIMNALPITVSATGVSYRGQNWNGVQYGAYFCYPNPASPAHYVVVSHRAIPGTAAKDLEALPWYWPDYVIFDTTRTAGATPQASLKYLPDTFVQAGYFDETWDTNAAPIAVDDAFSGPRDSILTVAAPGALGNDHDPDGDPLYAMLVGQATLGTVVLNADGGLTYTPNASGVTGDSFTYRVSDGALTSNTATVTLTFTVASPEADVAPRPNGDGTVASADALQVGRMVLGLDTPITTNELARADCAPRATRGDGALHVTDWVQAGRYAAGLDAPTASE